MLVALLASFVFLFSFVSCDCDEECPCSCDTGDSDEIDDDSDEESYEESGNEETSEIVDINWQAGWLVITEIMYDPAAIDDDDGEWVEVLNASGQILSLSSCTFSDDNEKHETVIDYPDEVEPGERLIFGIDRKDDSSQNVAPDWTWGDFNLANDEDGVRLICNDILIDEVYYSTDEFPFTLTEGISFSLCAEYENSEDNDDLRHWYASTTQMENQDYASPREQGKSCASTKR